jgi:hypothetical protein
MRGEASLPSGTVLRDAERGMDRLRQMVGLLPEASTFPADTLSAWFDLLTPLLRRLAGYGEVRDALDAATRRASGGDAVARRARARAMALAREGDLVAAVDELHSARIHWWQGDTLRGSLLASLLLASLYERLGLPLAAKQFSLSAAATAMSTNADDLVDLTPQALFAAANAEHAAGAWLAAADMTRIGFLAQNALAVDPWATDKHPWLEQAVHSLAVTFDVATQVRPGVVDALVAVMDSVGLTETVRDMVDGAAALSEPQWTELAAYQLSGLPFDDVGPVRHIAWSALGTTWLIECDNARSTVLASERFAAAAQIVIVELANHDPLLLPTDVHIWVDVDDGEPSAADCLDVTSDATSRWRVRLLPGDVTGASDDEPVRRQVITVLARILLTNSWLPSDRFLEIVHKTFARDLLGKLSVGRPYDELASIRPADRYELAASLAHRRFRAPDGYRGPVDLLPPPTGPGPGYDRTKAEAACSRRYENLLPMVANTLPVALADTRVCGVLRDLQEDGWFDWHLLTALANLAGNYRLLWSGLDPATAIAGQQQQIRRLMLGPEEAGAGTPPLDLVDAPSLRRALQISAASTLTTWGLTQNRETAPAEWHLRLLSDRYGFWSDDVTHQPLDLKG